MKLGSWGEGGGLRFRGGLERSAEAGWVSDGGDQSFQLVTTITTLSGHHVWM